ncbi:hypothetical protein [Spirosoma jeollabukense]
MNSLRTPTMIGNGAIAGKLTPDFNIRIFLYRTTYTPIWNLD